mgnify:CR=1 FL=1
MKKFLPLVLLLIGVVVFFGAFLIIKGRKEITDQEIDDEEETALLKLPQDKLPIVSLIPTEDGHYLKLRVERLTIEEAETLDFELLYEVPGDKPPQGVPGSGIKIKGEDTFETDLLLGSESSGYFRFDEGVEKGTIALKFRNNQGKLLVKLISEFHLQNQTDKLTSLDGKFTFDLDEGIKKGFFIVINTLGFPNDLSQKPSIGPYGIYTSGNQKLTGKVKLDTAKIYVWQSSSGWRLQDERTILDSGAGIFIGSI